MTSSHTYNDVTTLRLSLQLVLYTDIPALEPQPFGNPVRDKRMAKVQVFRTFPFEGETLESFWQKFGGDWVIIYYKFYFERTSLYKRWLREVDEKRPKGLDGLKYVIQEFNRQVTLLEMAPSKLLVDSGSRDPGIDLSMDALDQAFRQHFADQAGLSLIGWRSPKRTAARGESKLRLMSLPIQ